MNQGVTQDKFPDGGSGAKIQWFDIFLQIRFEMLDVIVDGHEQIQQLFAVLRQLAMFS